MNQQKKDILIVIPCYNESGSVRQVVDRVKSVHLDDVFLEPLVIDDCSLDETYCIASQSGKCVHLCYNLGIGGAVQTGIRYALEKRFHACVQVDGDGQHEASELKKLIRYQEDTGVNIVVGSRFIRDDENGFKSTCLRRFGIKLIAFVFRLLYGKRLTDPTSGFRLMDRKAIEFFSKNYPFDYPEPISLGQAAKAGLSIGETPVKMYEREAGTTSISGINCILYMLRVVGYLGIYRFK